MRPASSDTEGALIRVPLFPLKTVLFPRGHLALKIFEQRYLAMAKRCLTDETAFGVCLITRGDEVARPDAGAPQFASVGTFARIRAWDMPQLGILHVTAVGDTRFAVRTHEVMPDGLVVADVESIPLEPTTPLPAERRALAELLERLAARIGPQHFPDPHAFDDATWVGSRLAEILPLPLETKQALLEMNDADARLARLQRFIDRKVAS